MFRWALLLLIVTLASGVAIFAARTTEVSRPLTILFFVSLSLTVYTLLAGHRDLDRLN